MNLIIVESPTKSKTLTKFLGEGYKILASMGHIRDLPERKLGVDTKKDFTPDYVISKGKEDKVKEIQEAAKKADKIYLATDPDREGEAIAWHIGQLLKETKRTKEPRGTKVKKTSGSSGSFGTLDSSRFARITFHEITKTAIDNALKNPGQINMDLVNAQQARRILDRLVGYKLSPLLWYKIRKGLSAGRVQTVAVRLIVEREREIEKFVPKEYWQIFAELRKYLGGKMPDAALFTALLVKKNGNKIEVNNKTEADDIVSELEKAGYEVGEVEKKDSKRFPPGPFTTSTLQQAGANRLGWSAKRTMQVAQGLYEQGLITYHRTDSTNLALEAVGVCRDFIAKEYGGNYLPDSPRIYKTKAKVAQEAHEAVRPTDVQLKVKSEKLKVGVDEERLYDLIWKRFVACQMKESLVEETIIDVAAVCQQNIYILEARGEVEKFKGWKVLYDKKSNGEGEAASLGEGEGKEIQENSGQLVEIVEQLPPLLKGDALELQKLNPSQKFTQPPSRFNEASLIKTLEELGIGRPSTYAPTISTILERMYVEKKDRNFIPTNLGFAVNDFLMEYFPNVFDYQFTAHLEDDLDEIANGKKQWVPVIREFFEPFNLKLIGVQRVAERVAVETETTGEKCPTCKEGQVVIRVGKYGKFLSCSKFPQCRYTAPYIQKTGFKCPKCGADIVYKKTRKGKGFYGCAKYPKCDWASWRKPTK